jgi:hypothetical protein
MLSGLDNIVGILRCTRPGISNRSATPLHAYYYHRPPARHEKNRAGVRIFSPRAESRG